MHPKTVVITGASAGVGRATVREFARAGYNVALLARGIERLEAAAREVRAFGSRALICPVDMADANAVNDAARKTEETLGPIDVWVNNAMTSVFSPVLAMEPEEYRRVTEVTYLGYVHGTLAALRRMKPRNRGLIVQVGSALCFRGIPLQSAYCAAKHAIQGFTESLRAELIHDRSRIRVSMVHLPAMNTPQFEWSRNKMPYKSQPVPPIYEPEVAARAILWVTKHHRHHLFVGAPTPIVVWGSRFAPRAGDWYLGHTGYESQQTPQPRPRDAKDNLWESVPGPFGAHGRFDARSHRTSMYTWLTEHRAEVTSGALIAGALALKLLRARKAA